MQQNDKFKEGELVEVKDYESQDWQVRTFLFRDKNGKFLCLQKGEEQLYNSGKYYLCFPWSFARKINR